MVQPGRIVIGTRGSPLALAQARETQGRLADALGWAYGSQADVDALPLAVMTTTGDRIQDRPLSEAGGKGLFTKELDAALLEGAIDLAVHSAKDLPNALPEGLHIAGYLPREDARDALISPLADSLEGLPAGTVVGTASLRRQALVKRLRPDLGVRLLRGNVGTRLEKLGRGDVGATLLALAGLNRLGLADRVTCVLAVERFLPAVGQGAIALVSRTGDDRVAEALQPILHLETAVALAAERAFLAVLDGSCRTPIAGHARLRDDRLRLDGLVLSPDGALSFEASVEGRPADAERLGREAGLALRGRLPAGLFDA